MAPVVRRVLGYLDVFSAFWAIRAFRPTLVLAVLVALGTGPTFMVLTWFLFNLSDHSAALSATLRFLGIYVICGWVAGKIGRRIGENLAYAYFRALNKEVLDGPTEVEETVVETGAEA